jgi:hypothetical protein
MQGNVEGLGLVAAFNGAFVDAVLIREYVLKSEAGGH